MTVSLRPYQQHDVEAIRAVFRRTKSCIWRSPTGSGKSTASAFILGEAKARGFAGWFLTHRRELVDQASRVYQGAGIDHGIIAAGLTPSPRELIQIASIQTVARRAGKIPPPRFVIVDEAHHAASDQYKAIRAAYPDAFFLGLSATPLRLDGRPLGSSAGGMFDEMVMGPSEAELIEMGYLSPYTLFAPPNELDLSGVRTQAGDFARGELSARADKPTLIGSAIEYYAKICARKPAIAFAVSVAHAEHIAAQFQAAGYSAASIDGEMTTQRRRARIDGLRNGTIQVLASCELIGEGLDLPAVTTAILMRPTKSLGLWMQQCGRALRPMYAAGADLSTDRGRRDGIAAGPKPMAYILDHANNSFGQNHGFIDEPRDWSLDEGVTKRSAKDDSDRIAKVRQCQNCFAAFPPAPKCPHCGTLQDTKDRMPQHIDGVLAPIARDQIIAARKIEKQLRDSEKARDIKNAKTEDQLKAVAKKWSFHPLWVSHKLAGKAAAKAKWGR